MVLGMSTKTSDWYLRAVLQSAISNQNTQIEVKTELHWLEFKNVHYKLLFFSAAFQCIVYVYVNVYVILCDILQKNIPTLLAAFSI